MKRKIEDECGMPKCLCKHLWSQHHGGIVLNPDYIDNPLCPTGRQACECEATQTNFWPWGQGRDPYT